MILADCAKMDNKFQCFVCEKKLSSKGSLDLHVKTVHEKLKPYQCYICYREFAQVKIINVTSFSSVPYYSNVRLILKMYSKQNSRSSLTLTLSTFFGNKHGLGNSIRMQFNAK